MNDISDLTSRAIAAYFKQGKRGGVVLDQPSNDSGPMSVGGHDYVVLHNCNGVLAVYRVRTDGMLKRLKRWPTEIDAAL
jgi:hypothetical protein